MDNVDKLSTFCVDKLHSSILKNQMWITLSMDQFFLPPDAGSRLSLIMIVAFAKSLPLVVIHALHELFM
jgi:hypothetical protein